MNCKLHVYMNINKTLFTTLEIMEEQRYIKTGHYRSHTKKKSTTGVAFYAIPVCTVVSFIHCIVLEDQH